MANGWSDYARQQMPQIAVGAVAPPSKWFISLFTTTANPDGGTTPVEVAVQAYVRQQITFKLSGSLLINANPVIFPPSPQAFTFVGSAVTDGSHNIWFWDDNHPDGSIAANVAVFFNAGGCVVTPAT